MKESRSSWTIHRRGGSSGSHVFNALMRPSGTESGGYSRCRSSLRSVQLLLENLHEASNGVDQEKRLERIRLRGVVWDFAVKNSMTIEGTRPRGGAEIEM